MYTIYMISSVKRKLSVHLSSIILNLKVYRKPYIGISGHLLESSTCEYVSACFYRTIVV